MDRHESITRFSVPARSEKEELFSSLSNACVKITQREVISGGLTLKRVTELANDLVEIARIKGRLDQDDLRSSSAEGDGEHASWYCEYSTLTESYESCSQVTLYFAVFYWLMNSTKTVLTSELLPLLQPLLDKDLLGSQKVKAILAEAFSRWFQKDIKKLKNLQEYRQKMNAIVRCWSLFSLAAHFSSPDIAIKKKYQALSRFQRFILALPVGLAGLLDLTKTDLGSKYGAFELMSFAAAGGAIFGILAAGVMVALSLTHTVDALVVPIVGVGVVVLLAATMSVVFSYISYSREPKRVLPEDFSSNLTSCPASVFNQGLNNGFTGDDLRAEFGLPPEL